MFVPTHIIGKHLAADLPDIESFAGICAICGISGGVGLSIERVVTASFADVDWLTGGRHVCEFCLKCLGQGQPRNAWIKNVSCIATVNRLTRLTREDLWGLLINPPDEPFVFNITFNHKKHMSFKSRVNLGGAPYFVTTDIDTALIDVMSMSGMLAVMTAWYTICRDGAQQPTWFSKAEILQGSRNIRRIQGYGANRYLVENAVLSKWRGSHALEILTYALNKKEV